MKGDTSWERVAGWYDTHLQEAGTYQKELILPNLLRLMQIKKGERVLDLACGQGFFSREFAKVGAQVVGVDLSPSLIETARKTSPAAIEYQVAPADRLPFVKTSAVDKVAVVLALQNIDNAKGVLAECARVLRPGGCAYFVLNHPAFRIPKESTWGWDEKEKLQYRRVDAYLSESKVKIKMHPGQKPSEYTVSFHRPLQFYFKALHKAGLAVETLEEWNSHRKSEPGPRAKAENKARREIPLFLCLVGIKLQAK